MAVINEHTHECSYIRKIGVVKLYLIEIADFSFQDFGNDRSVRLRICELESSGSKSGTVLPQRKCI